MSVGLPQIIGHEPLLSRLAGAVVSRRFPQATLFVGPPGVGKQRIALWVAQALLCEAGRDRPCGECPSCRKVLGLSHPDLNWFVPIRRSKASDPDKQVEEAAGLLAGGLAVLGLDLGRSDRLIVAMTHFNFKSIFAWNMFLYSGFFAIVGAYLWTLLDRTVGGYATSAGRVAFVWRLVLTTGTGSIFGFLIAREAYASALLAPTFIVLSIAYGMAIYLLVLIAACAGSGRPLGREVTGRIGSLLGWFVLAALYFVAVFHLTNLYLAKQAGVERFLLVDGGVSLSLT